MHTSDSTTKQATYGQIQRPVMTSRTEVNTAHRSTCHLLFQGYTQNLDLYILQLKCVSLRANDSRSKEEGSVHIVFHHELEPTSAVCIMKLHCSLALKSLCQSIEKSKPA